MKNRMHTAFALGMVCQWRARRGCLSSSLALALALLVPPLAAHARSISRSAGPRVGVGFEWGDVNIIGVTDVHSWLSGHRHPDNTPELDAGYGDLRSFYDHAAVDARKQGRDVFLLNSGDLLEGTGLSDSTPVHGEAVTPIVEQMPYDAIVVGNHELGHDATVLHLQDSGFLKHWGGRYLTSNVFWAEGSGPRAGEPLGSRHTVLTGPNTGVRLLVFGFLFDFDRASPLVEVRKVDECLQGTWMDEAYAAESPDAVVVLAHMDLADALVYKILDKLRKIDAHIPVAVMAGHTHYRGFLQLDQNAASLESGKYLDTVSWLSFDTPARAPHLLAPLPYRPSPAATVFRHEFITASVASLAAACGRTAADFPTAAGAALKAEIALARAALSLDRVVGCAPRTYSVQADVGQEDSLWGLFMGEVVPNALFSPPGNPDLVGFSSVGSLR